MITLDFWSLTLLGGALQGFFLCAALFTLRRGNARANRLLATLAAAMALVLSEYLAIRSGLYFVDAAQHIVFVTTPLYFLIGPLFYFYTEFRLSMPRAERWQRALHALPAALVLINFLPTYFHLGGLHFFGARFYFIPLSGYWYAGLNILQTGVYLYLAQRRVREYETEMSNTENETVHLHLCWLRKFFALLLGVMLVHGGALLFLIWQRHVLAVEYVMALSLAVFVYTIGCASVRRPELFDEIAAHVAEEKYRKSALSSQQARVYLNKLLQYMENAKPYRDSELRLADLAERLAISPNHLSQVINQELRLNFFEFLNQYRVKEAQARLLEARSRHLTHLAIAYEVGFSNKTSFNRVFKRYTRMSPSTFVKAHACEAHVREE